MESLFDIQINTDCTAEEKRAVDWIEKSLRVAVVTKQLPPVEISIVITDNDTIQELNHQYREIDRPTDVLSFPLCDLNEHEEADEYNQPVLLGDIIISLTKAKEQAIQYGHSLERELGFLAVHGFLHLLGYDHETETGEKEMIAIQEEILNQVGLFR